MGEGEREGERNGKRKKEKEKSSMYWFTFQMTSKARTGLAFEVRCQEHKF